MDGLNKPAIKQLEWAVFGKIADYENDYANLFIWKNLIIVGFFIKSFNYLL